MLPELQSLGFTRNEANVYAAALKLGKCSVQQLATATGLNRITVHSIVEKLEGMQLLLRTYDGKRRRVSPVEPHRLEAMLAQEERRMEEKRHSFAAILPFLENLFRQTQRGMEIRTFQGESGYEEMCDDILTSKTEILEYANLDQLNAVIGPYIAADYLPTKHRLKIPAKFLYVDTPGARDYVRKNYIENKNAAPLQAKFVDPSFFAIDAYLVLYNQKVAVFTPKNLQGVIIRDEAITHALRVFWTFVWDRAGKVITNTVA
jgi:sugar-specific transcriptional regulator TrmB